MENVKECRIIYDEKDNMIYEDYIKQSIFENLAHDLVSKKINKCTWIRKIKREQLYTHVRITVYWDNGYRTVYKLNASNF